MGRTVVRRVETPRRRRATNFLLVAGAIIVVLFALVGVVAAGVFVGNHVASSSYKPKSSHHTSGNTNLAVQDISRAQAQATAIVRAAQDAGKAIVGSASKKARKQAAAIVAQARQKAATTAAAGQTAPSSTTSGTTTSPSTTASGSSVASGTSGTTGGVTSATGALGTSATGAVPTPVPGAPATVPNLSGVPASWLVVGYNATFGNGPGSAGSISVVNRSGKTFSGVASVTYYGPSGTLGSASGTFSGLAPGQSEVLALNGSPYPAGATGYHISVAVR